MFTIPTSTAFLCGLLANGTGFAWQGLADTSPFPLHISPTHRHLTDHQGTPFLIVGDTAWSIIAQLDEPQIESYLEDRQKRGFNAIIVNLVEHKFCTRPPRTRSGLAPFNRPGDFSTPNDSYFEFAHRVLEKANARGISVWLAPAYLGYGGGDEGFYREIKAGGPEKLRAYGRYLGQRFKDLPNIVWLLGGDYTPAVADRWTVTALAEAIRETDPNHFMTIHNAPEQSAAAIYGDVPWLEINTVYSYDPLLFRPVFEEYGRTPVRPFVLIETTYEGEHDSTPDQIRRQAYWAILGGASGQFLGNSPIWHFDGPGLFLSNRSWQQALDAPGSHAMARLHSLFDQLRWSELIPETNHVIVSDGFGGDKGTALTSRTPDGKLSVTYFPSTGTQAREVTIDTSQLALPAAARWFNPTDGPSPEVTGPTFSSQGRHRISTPGDNGAQANDWVLVLGK